MISASERSPYYLENIRYVSIRNACSHTSPHKEGEHEEHSSAAAAAAAPRERSLLCEHQVKIVLKDESQVVVILNGLEIWTIIAGIDDTQIRTMTPSWLGFKNTTYDTKPERPKDYKRHFYIRDAKKYETSRKSKILNAFKFKKDNDNEKEYDPEKIYGSADKAEAAVKEIFSRPITDSTILSKTDKENS